MRSPSATADQAVSAGASDAATTVRTPDPGEARKRWIGFVVASLGQMAMFVNITQTTAVLAPLQQDLRVSGAQLVWIAGVYSMMVASFVLSAGTVGDRFGRRRVFALGMVLLGGGSLVTSLASGASGVIVGQALMGLGGAAILPNSLSLVTGMFAEPHARTRAVGIWVAVSGIGLAFGPVAAGLILERWSWHAVFLVNVVLAVLVLVLTPRFVTESRQPGRHLDPPGLVLAVLAIGALNYGLVEGGHTGFGTTHATTAFAVAAASLAAFVVHEARTRTPMLKLRLFRGRSFATANVVAMIAQYAFVATAFAQVLYFERIRHESILDAGLLLLPLMGSYVLVSYVAAAIARRIGFKATLGVGALLASAGTLLMTAQTPTSSTEVIVLLMAMFGAGAGLVLPPSTAVAVISVPQTDGGMASGTVNLFRQVGGTLGATVTGTVLTSGLASRLPGELSDRGVPSRVADQVTQAVGTGAQGSTLPAALRDTVTDAVGGAFTGALHLAVLIPGVGLAAAAVAALVLVANRPAPQAH
ncbi:MFS transporter [Actinacidiphila glaucinigra]|uniref:MFS transporter n=1 Tax=Actinacidiphila glaucinigra TaxID=235986 RepID=UPI0038678B74